MTYLANRKFIASTFSFSVFLYYPLINRIGHYNGLTGIVLQFLGAFAKITSTEIGKIMTE